MSLSRISLSVSALAMLSFAATPTVRADDIVAALNVSTSNGVAVGTLTYTDVAGVQQYTYSNLGSNLFDTTDNEFTATYADLLGVQTLTVTDTCTQVNVVTPAVPCQQLAFAFEDVSVGDANLLDTVGDASAVVDGQLAVVAFGASVGTSSATFNYNPPVDPAPEPASLALTATGLLGIAGVIRRKLPPTA